MEQIKLDMIPKGITPIAHASQYDQGRLIHFILMDNLQAFILTDETVMIKVCKPDNNIVTGEATYTANTNIVTISTTEQMTAVAGDSKCELSITKNNIKVGSLNFILRVEEDPLKDGVESETVIANLDTIIDNAVSEALNDTVLYGAYPTAEIDNVPIASFSDGADDVPVKALQIGINAIQEGTGTPSPDNIRPISGFTGANIKVAGSNLWDEDWEVQGTFIWSKNYIPVKPNTSYYRKSPYNLFPRFYDNSFTEIGTGIWGKDNTFTTPSNASYLKFMVDPAYGTTYNNDISINYPATDTEYHAYNPNSKIIPVSWQDEAGIVYGGYLRIVNSIVKLVATHFGKLITDTSEILDESSGTVGFRARVEIPSGRIPPADSQSGYDEQKSNVATYVGNAGSIGSNIGTDSFKTHTNGNIYFYLVGYDTLEDLKTYAQTMITANKPISFVWKLATPIEYTLTGIPPITTLQGTNNIFTDTGDIQNLIYRRDMNSIVEAIPAPPSENGTYSLKCTVSGGVASYSWVAD